MFFDIPCKHICKNFESMPTKLVYKNPFMGDGIVITLVIKDTFCEVHIHYLRYVVIVKLDYLL